MTNIIQNLKFKKIKYCNSELSLEQNVFLIGKNGCGKSRFLVYFKKFIDMLQDVHYENNNFIIKNDNIYNMKDKISLEVSFDISINLDFDESKNMVLFGENINSFNNLNIRDLFKILSDDEIKKCFKGKPNDIYFNLNTHNKSKEYTLKITHNKSIISYEINENKLEKYNFNIGKKKDDFNKLFEKSASNVLINKFNKYIKDHIVFCIQNNLILNEYEQKFLLESTYIVNNILNKKFPYFNYKLLNILFNDSNICCQHINNNKKLFFFRVLKNHPNDPVSMDYSHIPSSLQTIIYYLCILLYNNRNGQNKLFVFDEFDDNIDNITLNRLINIINDTKYFNSDNQLLAILQNPYSLTSNINGVYLVQDKNIFINLSEKINYNRYFNIDHIRDFLIGDHKTFIIVEGEIDYYLLKCLIDDIDNVCIVQTDGKYNIYILLQFLEEINYFKGTNHIKIKIIYDIDNENDNKGINLKIETIVKNCSSSNITINKHQLNLEDAVSKECLYKNTHMSFKNRFKDELRKVILIKERLTRNDINILIKSELLKKNLDKSTIDILIKNKLTDKKIDILSKNIDKHYHNILKAINTEDNFNILCNFINILYIKQNDQKIEQEYKNKIQKLFTQKIEEIQIIYDDIDDDQKQILIQSKIEEMQIQIKAKLEEMQIQIKAECEKEINFFLIQIQSELEKNLELKKIKLETQVKENIMKEIQTIFTQQLTETQIMETQIMEKITKEIQNQIQNQIQVQLEGSELIKIKLEIQVIEKIVKENEIQSIFKSIETDVIEKIKEIRSVTLSDRTLEKKQLILPLYPQKYEEIEINATKNIKLTNFKKDIGFKDEFIHIGQILNCTYLQDFKIQIDKFINQ